MTELALESSGVSLLAVVAIHFIAGLALGRWFRFGALLPAFAVVLAESLLGGLRFGIAPWYVLFVGGIVVVQVGYAVAARLTPSRRGERPGAAGSYRVSTPD